MYTTMYVYINLFHTKLFTEQANLSSEITILHTSETNLFLQTYQCALKK